MTLKTSAYFRYNSQNKTSYLHSIAINLRMFKIYSNIFLFCNKVF